MARSTSPTTAPRPTSTSAITSASPASPPARATTSPRAGSTRASSPASAAATISAPPSRSSPTSPTRSRSSSRADLEEDCDFLICEVGGTVGDIESCPSSRRSASSGTSATAAADRVSIHTTLVPYIAAAGELKTKPTQHSVRELTCLGIQPEIIVCRCEQPLPDSDRAKIALFCNVRKEAVIPALDATASTPSPPNITPPGSTPKCCAPSASTDAPEPDMARWDDVIDRLFNPEGEVTIGVVGKYVGLHDAYKSADRGAGPRRPRQPRQGQHPTGSTPNCSSIPRPTSPPSSSRCTPSSSPAASASAAAKARSPASTSPASARSPSSASASACRWPASRRRGTPPGSKARAAANSAKPKSPSSASSPNG